MSGSSKWVVQQNMLCGGWETIGIESGEQVYFESAEEATKDMLQLFDDLEDAQMDYDPEEYRVVELRSI